MSLGVASLELGGKPWVSDWADVTPARTREAQGGCGPGEWEWGRMWCQGWVLVTPYPLFPRLFLSVFGFPRKHLSYALNFDLCLFTTWVSISHLFLCTAPQRWPILSGYEMCTYAK